MNFPLRLQMCTNDARLTLTLRRTHMTANRKYESKCPKSDEKKRTGNQDFAFMPKEQVREIAREGGKGRYDNDVKNRNQVTSKKSAFGQNRDEDDAA